MCNHSYIVPDQRRPRPNGNRCPYPELYSNISTTSLGGPAGSQPPELPIDPGGRCIFHSEDLDWKRANDFPGKLDELRLLLDGTAFNYDFAEFVLVGNELTSQAGSEKHVLRIADTTFHKEAIFTGASFRDQVEFDGVNFEHGATFPRAHFLRDLRISNTHCRSLDFEKAQLEGTVFFVDVDCANQALFNDARFTGKTDSFVVKFEGVRFQGLTTFADSSFLLGDESTVGFQKVTFEEFADFSNAQLRCHVAFNGVSFSGTAEFIDTVFDSVGSAARYRGAAVEFNRIEVKAGGSLTFMSTDPNTKMFNHAVVFTFKEDPAGIVRFENVQFSRILTGSRQQLLRLSKGGNVEIGPGCIKYRFQTGLRTIFVEQGNTPLILELCQTFTNYFTASNGLNLGFEVVERDASKVSFFYFTDENITEIEFLERLAQTERHMWNLLSVRSNEEFVALDAPAGVAVATTRKNAVIHGVDALAALFANFFRVGVRIATGTWRERDTQALLGAIRFNGEGAEQRAHNLHQALAEKYSGQNLFVLSGQQNQFLIPMNKTGSTKRNPPTVKILFLGANSSREPLELEKEVQKIQNNLRMGLERDNLVLRQEWVVTIDSLMQAMLDESPTIVHFAGHGEESGIILQDEIGQPRVVSGDALSSLFRLFKDTVKCVVLNSCYSELQARAIREHIPYVIGTRTKILDAAAIAFSTGFYKAISAGRDVPFAFDMGEVAVKMECGEGENIPILL